MICKLGQGKLISLFVAMIIVFSMFFLRNIFIIRNQYYFLRVNNKLDANKKLSLVKRNYLQEEKKVDGPTIPVIPQKSLIYTIKLGDTLYSMGKKYNIDYKEIGEINSIKNLNLIFVGEKLVIPQN